MEDVKYSKCLRDKRSRIEDIPRYIIGKNIDQYVIHFYEPKQKKTKIQNIVSFANTSFSKTFIFYFRLLESI